MNEEKWTSMTHREWWVLTRVGLLETADVKQEQWFVDGRSAEPKNKRG